MAVETADDSHRKRAERRALKPEAVLTANHVNMTGLNFRGVKTAACDSRAWARSRRCRSNDDLNVSLTELQRADGGHDQLAVELDHVAPLFTLAPVFVSVTANGGGFQAVNIRVLGDEIFDTGRRRRRSLVGAGDAGDSRRADRQPGQPADHPGERRSWAHPGCRAGPVVAVPVAGRRLVPGGHEVSSSTPFDNAWTVARRRSGRASRRRHRAVGLHRDQRQGRG